VKQTTLADRVVVEGIGVHGGKAARIVLHPAEANAGIAFLRTQPERGRERIIEARHGAVHSTDLCTVLAEENGASVATVEHLLSALAGLGIDNLLIEIDGPEMPILDGSARLFVEAIDQVGTVTQSATRRCIVVKKPVRVQIGTSIGEMLPNASTFRVDVEIAFDNVHIGRQRRVLDVTPARYRREVANARTFGFMRDVERLWKAGLALGASLDNTVALGEDGVINPEGLRYPDEFVRHKMLDAIGDLALAGAPIRGTYRAFCPGHKLNVAMVQALYADRSAFDVVEMPRRRERGYAEVSLPVPAFRAEAG